MGIKADFDKMMEQLKALGKIGIDSTGARTKLALTDNDKLGRDLVIGFMKELELDVRIDKMGNVVGIYNPDKPGEIPEPGTAIMMGSHIDSVMNAGEYDGCYGVISGLAVIRAFKQSGVKPKYPLAAAFFSNEEGTRFQPDMQGTVVYVDKTLLNENLDRISIIDGKRYGDELERIGYAGKEEPGFLVPRMFFELHIEQGPVLEAEGINVGAVTGIQGISWHKVTVYGVANHAGTTPTRLRHDAAMTAFHVGTAMRALSVSTGTTLATVGSIAFEPNAINVVPDKVVFTVDLRDPDENKLQYAEKYLEEQLEKFCKSENTTYERQQVARYKPVFFNEELIKCVEKTAEKMNLSCIRIVSGAGHDAQIMSSICPTTMIFVPSKDGISHNPKEYTEPEDLKNGLDMLLNVVMENMK